MYNIQYFRLSFQGSNKGDDNSGRTTSNVREQTDGTLTSRCKIVVPEQTGGLLSSRKIKEGSHLSAPIIISDSASSQDEDEYLALASTRPCRARTSSIIISDSASSQDEDEYLALTSTRPCRARSAPVSTSSDIEKIHLISQEIEKILPNKGDLFKDLMLTYYYH